MRLQWRNVFTTLPRNHLVPFRPQVTFKMGYSYATRVLERPCLRAQKDNGDVVDAQEEDLYRYTTKRWLANETFETSQRYRKFNIETLLAAASVASTSKAGRCIQVMKYREGQYNKAFLLTFDNGFEVVAKLPNPNAGPQHWTTASEVATMDYARTILNLPVPRVLSWDCDASNPIESEYIIMEKVKGVPLSQTWFGLSLTTKYKIIMQIVDIEARLCSATFPTHGCLYYTANTTEEKNHTLASNPRERFRIGPVVDPLLWRDERYDMPLSRGPWHTLSDYAISMGQNERTWALHYAKPRMNYYRSNVDPEMPSEYIELVDKYLLAAPYLTKSQPDTEDLSRPTLWHSDLHLNNVYIDPETYTITGIIDWQGTTAAPLLLQAKIPRMLHHPEFIPHGDFVPQRPDKTSLSKEELAKADKLYLSARCHKYYELATRERNPRHYAALNHNHEWKLPLVKPLLSINGAWSDREVFRLRGSLMSVVGRWTELYPPNEQNTSDSGSTSCPISFTQTEKELHNEEVENRETIEEMMEGFQEEGILPLDGRVDPEDYEVAQRRNETQKDTLLSMIEDEVDRAWLDKVWPYQDWPEGA